MTWEEITCDKRDEIMHDEGEMLKAYAGHTVAGERHETVWGRTDEDREVLRDVIVYGETCRHWRAK